MSLLDAATDLVNSCNSDEQTYEDAMECARDVLDVAADASQSELDGAIQILLAAVRALDVERAGIGAIVCGALVERGADATLVSEHLLERFVALVDTCVQYVDRCRDYFNASILSEDACDICGPNDDEQDVMMPQVREAVSARFPEGEASWIALDLFCRPAVSVLLRVRTARRQHADDIAFVNAIGSLSMFQSGAYYVWALLSMLDDEPLTIVEPATRQAWELRMNGVTDNGQLHILLADLLITHGLLDGEAPEAAAVDVARGVGPQLLDDYVLGNWNLYNWSALKEDGSLPDGYFDQGVQHLIHNEGVPANIWEANGRRTILLGPAPIIRQWRPARLFGPLEASLTLERTLDADEVSALLASLHALSVSQAG